MKISVFSICLMSLVFITSCKKEVETQNTPPPKQMDVVWQTALLPENSPNVGSNYLEAGPILVNNNLLFYSNETQSGLNKPLFYLDTANGAIVTTWSNATGSYYARDEIVNSGNHVLFSDLNNVTCLDAISNTVKWSTTLAGGTRGIYENEGYVYKGVRFNQSGSGGNSSAIIRTQTSSGQWDTVYSFNPAGNYSSYFVGCGFGSLPNGDEVLVWKNQSQIGWDSIRAEIFAFNLTADSLLWKSESFEREFAYSGTLKVNDGIVYGLLEQSVVAIDLHSGNTLWTKKLWPSTNFNQQEDHFYIDGQFVLISYPMNSSISLVYLNKSNGEIDHIISGLPSIATPYTYFEGKLFGAGDGISCIDITTGSNLLNNYKINETEYFMGPVVIDPNRRVMYSHDIRNAYAIRIPDY